MDRFGVVVLLGELWGIFCGGRLENIGIIVGRGLRVRIIEVGDMF